MITSIFTGFILPNSYLCDGNSNQCFLVGYQMTPLISHLATCGHNLRLKPSFRSSLVTEDMYCLCYVKNCNVYGGAKRFKWFFCQK